MKNQEQSLKDILAKVLAIDTSRFNDNTALLGALPELDSMAIMMLLLDLESGFNISIDPTDISAEYFESFSTLKDFVKAQQCLPS